MAWANMTKEQVVKQQIMDWLERRGERVIRLLFDIEPVPKGRPVFVTSGATWKGFGRAITPHKTRVFEHEIKTQAKIQYGGPPLDEPVCVGLVFTLVRPKSSKRITADVKPDLDNLQKSVLDALEGVIYECDSRIVSVLARKQYGDSPKIEFFASSIEQSEDVYKAVLGEG